ncbi:MAG: hemoglobin [Marinoscillum sp.]
MKDLATREDIVKLVDAFYKKAINDEVLGHFFTEVVQLDFAVHMPVMYDFWESTLLGNHVYKGNPMLKHIALSKKSPITSAHFERWLDLWVKTVNLFFEGQKAAEAVSKATQIAALMQYKIAAHGNN